MARGMPSLGPRLTTRPGNKDKQPAIDTGYRKPWRKNRTKAEILADEEKAASAKLKSTQQQKKLTSKVAALEDSMREEDIRRDAEADHPLDPVLPAEEEEADELEEELAEESEPEDQSGAYVAGAESESEGEEPSEDEPESKPKPRGRSSAVKSAGKAGRSDVAAQRQTAAQSGTPKVAATAGQAAKRKASLTSQKSVAKKSKSSKKAGLAPVRGRTASSASNRSMAVDSDEDDHMVKLGGPAIDDDVNEDVERKKGKNRKRGKPAESIIKITVPPKAQTLKQLRDGRDKWTTADLPAGAALLFKEDVTPLIRERVGFQADPWEPPSDDTVQDILNLVYSADDAPSHDVSEPVWQGLIQSRLHDWRGAFGTQAVKGIQLMVDAAKNSPPLDADAGDSPPSSDAPGTESEHQDSDEAMAPEADEDEAPPDEAEDDDPFFDLKTPAGVAAFVEWALQVVDHTSPFHWRKWRKGVRKEGLFEGDLIVYTFAAHLTAVDSIPVKYQFDPEEAPTPPIGAMILCIQAVERALRAWSTGELVLSSKPIHHFSKDHWGDTTKQRNGKDVKDKRATKYVGTLRSLDDGQWYAIHEAALRWVEPKKRSGSSRSSSMDASMVELESDEDDNFVLAADVCGALIMSVSDCRRAARPSTMDPK
ncbi:hypothetical protein B0H17DRAFT_1202456 [Mycena rosella]|uniref:Uncharacterized protein n=1 Tax=Mycena rosella TaxID=1033263 RepID=A0AAD7DEE6_MYCRO|nr:hypothetical protein B0H17DRAFT_1202456 [Mycena rosella]